MTVRATMTALITRTRLLINDPSSSSQVFDDQTIQDVLDESRADIINGPLIPEPTFSGSTIQYLDYYAGVGSWEDGAVLRQYYTVVVTPATVDNIVGHWTFATTTLPPLYATGHVFDLYRSAADLLERWAAKWVLSYNVTVDGQNLSRSQVAPALLTLAHTYRMKQRAVSMDLSRSDLNAAHGHSGNVLGPQGIDYL